MFKFNGNYNYLVVANDLKNLNTVIDTDTCKFKLIK